MSDEIVGSTRQGAELTWSEIMATSTAEIQSNGKIPVTVFDDDVSMFSRLARYIADFIRDRNEQGLTTVMIVPVGPKNHYPELADICNREKISWKNVHCFNMDEWLTWDCQEFPLDHPFSFQGYMRRNLYDLIDNALRPPESNLWFPTPSNMTTISDRLRELGGADLTFAGFGYSGHVALNEPPQSRWVRVSVEDFRRSETRILPLNDETLIAFAHRTSGGDTNVIPPMAVTLGMKDLLASKKFLFVSNSGEWKQHTLRVLLFHEPTVMYPCTLVQSHPDAEIWVDENTARPPQRIFKE